ncbi:MAG: hypothetical protein QOJ20_5219 [Mycobacterium sp.]|jgi:hypothetical protein|nr:hypothetical protein [Mycobacterium sp.]
MLTNHHEQIQNRFESPICRREETAQGFDPGPIGIARAILGHVMEQRGLTPACSRPQQDPLPPKRIGNRRGGDAVAGTKPRE